MSRPARPAVAWAGSGRAGPRSLEPAGPGCSRSGREGPGRSRSGRAGPGRSRSGRDGPGRVLVLIMRAGSGSLRRLCCPLGRPGGGARSAGRPPGSLTARAHVPRLGLGRSGARVGAEALRAGCSMGGGRGTALRAQPTGLALQKKPARWRGAPGAGPPAVRSLRAQQKSGWHTASAVCVRPPAACRCAPAAGRSRATGPCSLTPSRALPLPLPLSSLLDLRPDSVSTSPTLLPAGGPGRIHVTLSRTRIELREARASAGAAAAL